MVMRFSGKAMVIEKLSSEKHSDGLYEGEMFPYVIILSLCSQNPHRKSAM